MNNEAFQKKFAQEMEKMTMLQKEVQKPLSAKVTLEGQLSENQVVKEELDLLEPENPVFKLTGPVMIPYDIEEAKQNVSKRIEYINGEIKRVNDMVSEAVKKQEAQREVISKLEKQLKSFATKSAAVA